jgi:hypothetical protein
MPRPRRSKGVFVLAVVGDVHVRRSATAIKYLKAFSRAEIVVLQSRSRLRAPHDQIVDVVLPGRLSDHSASRLLKTDLLTHLGGAKGVYCYIDSDVMAVRDDVDAVFDQLNGCVRFAQDHVDIDTFSRWAVRCGCESHRCPHLREEAERKFEIVLPDGGWRHWNSGVFLFSSEARAFFERWRDYTDRILDDPRWRPRDQGSLAAAAWRMGLQAMAPLQDRFNFIVDRLWGVEAAERPALAVGDFHVREDFGFRDEPGRAQPRLIHFINDGVGQIGWRHWDEVEALLDRKPPPSRGGRPRRVHRDRPLAASKTSAQRKRPAPPPAG